jgi:23S rRNA (guanosine2251-2'-O)-methyltransferase
MYGHHAVFAALQNPKRVIKQIFCTQRYWDSYEKDLNTKKEIVKIVDVKEISALLDSAHPVPHQGILAKVSSIFSSFETLDITQSPNRILILDQLVDTQNIGNIIRSAVAFGFDKIILSSDNMPNENGAMNKAAVGTMELVQIAQVVNIKRTIDILKKHEFWIAGLDPQGPNQISDILNIAKLAIIIGSEGAGMRRLTKDSCDFLVNIPISTKVESINAASAASIVLHATKLL